MEFSDDIALGDFTSADFDSLVDEADCSGCAQPTSRPFFGFRLSFAISAILHFALAPTLFYFVVSDIGIIEDPAPGLIRVEFIPLNPLLNQVEEINPETQAPIRLVEPDASSLLGAGFYLRVIALRPHVYIPITAIN